MAGQTSIDTHPAQAPEGKTSRNRGTDHRHSLYSRSTRPATATFAGRSRVKKGFSLLGAEDIVHQPGWDLWLL
ncbi:hypothetical protein B0T21DRAFT_366262 [Apiosordaria backusii]|uniref:Uncharacterized protein n=1 Tax=Apiosordaria backusii TaxID=314023 RepID=A0AA40BKX1_9PEZI|nr:hypothetical protein B0T21DRAFT_366262 [Apiosordaria backusii]